MNVDWSNERYVRLYTRDTATWLRWPWQSRCLFMALLRKVDRHGVLDLDGGGAETLAVVVGLPDDVVDAGLVALTRPDRSGRRTVEFSDEKVGIPNFVDAQEARASNAKRCRDYRARMTDTKRVIDTEDVETDTPQHAATHSDTPSLAVPSRAEPNQESKNTHKAGAPARSNPSANHPDNPERSGEPKSAQDAFKRPTVEATKHPAAQTPKSPPVASQAPGSDPLTAEVWAALKAHGDLTPVATWDLASRIAGRAHAAGRPVAWLAVAISDAAREAGARAGIGQPFDTASLASLVTRYCDRAKAPLDGKASGVRFRRPEDIRQGEWSMSDAERARVAEQDRARPSNDDDLEAFLADLPADEAEAMRKALKVAS